MNKEELLNLQTVIEKNLNFKLHIEKVLFLNTYG
jgi:hypothetical protein